jgi:type II secretory pathway component PulF
MLNAGVGLQKQLETIRTSERDDHRKRQYTYILEQINQGKSLTQAFRKTQLVPVFDLPIIETGEKSGQLPRVCQILSKSYQRNADSEKKIRRGLNYPFFLFSASVFIPNFPKLFLGTITLPQYLFGCLSIIGGVVVVALIIYNFLMRSYFDLELAKLKHKVFTKIPLLYYIATRSAQERFCSSLAMMLHAGLPILEALSLAGQTSPDDQITMASRRIIAEIKSGKSLPRAFQGESVFNEDIQNSIVVGAESGNIPELLERSAEILKKNVDEAIDKITFVVPQVIYWIALLVVAANILGLYATNIMTLSNMLSGV